MILAKCENCTTRLSSCYEEDCGIQNEANQKLAIIENMLCDADGNEIISLALLRELMEAERNGCPDYKAEPSEDNGEAEFDEFADMVEEAFGMSFTDLSELSTEYYEGRVIIMPDCNLCEHRSEKNGIAETVCDTCIGNALHNRASDHFKQVRMPSEAGADEEFMRNAMYDQLHSNGN